MLLMPESPRWHILRARFKSKLPQRAKHYEKAFDGLRYLRHTKLQAGRDLFLLETWINREMNNLREPSNMGQKPYRRSTAIWDSLKKYRALLTEPRCFTALVASLIVMVWQQLCGINVLTYYSSWIFLQQTGPGGRNCTLEFSIPTNGAEGKVAIKDSFKVS